MKLLSIAAISMVLFAAACKSTVATGPVLATNKFADKNLQQLSNTKVTGSACRQHIFFVPIGSMDFADAYQQAIATAPEGTTGLKSADLSVSIPVVGGLLFGRYCAIVSGFPAKATITR